LTASAGSQEKQGRCDKDKHIGATSCKDKTIVDYALLFTSTLHSNPSVKPWYGGEPGSDC